MATIGYYQRPACESSARALRAKIRRHWPAAAFLLLAACAAPPEIELTGRQGPLEPVLVDSRANVQLFALPEPGPSYAIFVDGTITTDTAEAFRELGAAAYARQARAPEIRVHLGESFGGQLEPSLAMGAQIREAGWDTRIETICASACVLVWLAGDTLSVSPDAHVAVHSASYQVRGLGVPLWRSEAGNRLIAEYLAALGYPSEVAEFFTGSTPWWFEMWTAEDSARLGVEVEVW